jgi:S-adenosylmethionine synthetase
MSGKNPSHFSGLIYTLAAKKIAWKLYDHFNTPCYVYISANNGDTLSRPHRVDVEFVEQSVSEEKVNDVIFGILDNIDEIRSQYIERDTFASFHSCTHC